MSNKYWEVLWHPFRALEVHYNQIAWERLSRGVLKAWPSFGEIQIDTIIDWNIDPFNNKTWKLYFHSLNWTYSHLWGIDNKLESHERLHQILSQYIDYLQSENVDEMAWFDHTTSDRLCAISAIILHPSSNKMDSKLLEKLNSIIGIHISKICEYYKSEFWYDSNHGVFHALALINISSIYPLGPNDEDVNKIGIDYLNISLQGILSLEEGISLEQSTYYHQLAIELVESINDAFLEMIGIYKDDFVDKMVEANYWFTSNNRNLIPIGDTSVISKAPELHMPPNIPDEFLKSYIEGGVSIVKQNSDEGVNYFAMLHRKKRAPHGHYDALSVILEHNDVRFIVDSGGPYEYGTNLRYEYFMSSFAHNVILVNQKPHQSGSVLKRTKIIEDGVFLIEAKHSGYEPIEHNRVCLVINDIGLIVIDSLTSINEDTRLDVLWHLDPECSYVEESKTISNGNQSIEFWSSEDNLKLIKGDQDVTLKSWTTDKISNKIESPLLVNKIMTNKDTTIVHSFGYNGKIKCKIEQDYIICTYNGKEKRIFLGDKYDNNF